MDREGDGEMNKKITYKGITLTLNDAKDSPCFEFVGTHKNKPINIPVDKALASLGGKIDDDFIEMEVVGLLKVLWYATTKDKEGKNYIVNLLEEFKIPIEQCLTLLELAIWISRLGRESWAEKDHILNFTSHIRNSNFFKDVWKQVDEGKIKMLGK